MNKTKQFFDEYAEKWDDVNRYDRSSATFEDIISLLNLKKDSKVVDLGCGTGILIPYLLKQIGKKGLIYAVDISDKMLAKLSEKFQNPVIRTFPLKAEELSRIDDKTDAVICFSTFPHFDDKNKAINEISKILRPGGRLLIAHLSSRKEINQFHQNLCHPICHHDLPDEEKMKNIMALNGFKILTYKDKPANYVLLAERK